MRFLQFEYLNTVFASFKIDRQNPSIKKAVEKRLNTALDKICLFNGEVVIGRELITVDEGEIAHLHKIQIDALDLLAFKQGRDYDFSVATNGILFLEDTPLWQFNFTKQGDVKIGTVPKVNVGVLCLKHPIYVKNEVGFEMQRLYLDAFVYEKLLEELVVRKI